MCSPTPGRLGEETTRLWGPRAGAAQLSLGRHFRSSGSETILSLSVPGRGSHGAFKRGRNPVGVVQ